MQDVHPSGYASVAGNAFIATRAVTVQQQVPDSARSSSSALIAALLSGSDRCQGCRLGKKFLEQPKY